MTRIPRLWAARPLRFALTGGSAALVQLGILDALTDGRWSPILADAVALLLSTQVNIVLSYLFTWRDRRPRAGTPRAVLGRWAAYQGSAAGAALLNIGVFVVARTDLPIVVASALGTVIASVVNFVASDRLVFPAAAAAVAAHGSHGAWESAAARGAVDRMVRCREDA